MVCIVTLNPCVDKTVFIDSLSSTPKVNRSYSIAGGKGNNVARVLKCLNVDYVSLNLIAGTSGEYIRALLSSEGINAEYYCLEGQSRFVTTISDRNWGQTVLKENTLLTETIDYNSIIDWVSSYLSSSDFLCISGSIPNDSFEDVPKGLIEKAHEMGIPVLFDGNKSGLLKGLMAKPDYCKPNFEEIHEIYEGSEHQMLAKLAELGIRCPVISLGKDGAVSMDGNNLIKVYPPEIEAINPVGSGDSFVAGLIFGLMQNYNWVDCLKSATACGAVNASKWEVAQIDLEEYNRFFDKVRIIRE